MSTTINGIFKSRRDADMAIERLVQEFGVERTDIFAAAGGNENSSGVAVAGADNESGAPSPEARDDGALNGPVNVSVDLNEDERTAQIVAAFEEFGGAAVADE